MSVRGGGPNLRLPTLGFSLPLTVQLRGSNGACWGAEYGQADVTINTATSFVGRGGPPSE
jgi:hypothetical protein